MSASQGVGAGGLGWAGCCLLLLAGVALPACKPRMQAPRGCRVDAGAAGRAPPERSLFARAAPHAWSLAPQAVSTPRASSRRSRTCSRATRSSSWASTPSCPRCPPPPCARRRRRRHAPPAAPRRCALAPPDRPQCAGCRATRSGWTMCSPTCSRGSRRCVGGGGCVCCRRLGPTTPDACMAHAIQRTAC